MFEKNWLFSCKKYSICERFTVLEGYKWMGGLRRRAEVSRVRIPLLAAGHYLSQQCKTYCYMHIKGKSSTYYVDIVFFLSNETTRPIFINIRPALKKVCSWCSARMAIFVSFDSPPPQKKKLFFLSRKQKQENKT